MMMRWSQVQFQDARSPLIEEFLFFHDFVIINLVFILSGIGWLIVQTWLGRRLDTTLLEGQVLEGLWTTIPALVLVQIAVPSLLLLYSLDESADGVLRVKAIGHQWYWSYEYSGHRLNPEGVEFDSYMAPAADSRVRLLDVDNRAVLPWGASVRVLVGSADVLHSWTVPRLGIKADACPGRLNQLKLLGHRPGLFFGQCSEICGANHSFIPIVVELVRVGDYLAWASQE